MKPDHILYVTRLGVASVALGLSVFALKGAGHILQAYGLGAAIGASWAICAVALACLYLALRWQETERLAELRAAIVFALDQPRGEERLFLNLYRAGSADALQAYFPAWQSFRNSYAAGHHEKASDHQEDQDA